MITTQQPEPTGIHLPEKTGKVKVLALNGGGARGLYTISVLAQLEQIIEDEYQIPNVRIGDYFDLITGTSIGGILALGLASGKSARELKEKFKDSAPSIFPTWRFFFQTFIKVFFPVYDSEPLRNTVKNMIGDNTTFKDLTRRVMIPSVNLSEGCPRFFKTPHGEFFHKDANVKLIDAAMATSAAPTYFKPHFIESEGHFFADGGLVANNPSYIGLREVLIDMQQDFKGISVKDINILNVGTLNENFCIRPKTLKRKWITGYIFLWGLGKRLVESTMTANQDMQKKMLIRELRPLGLLDNYVEIDKTIPNEASQDIALDNASKYVLGTIEGWGINDAHHNYTQNPKLRAFFTSPSEPFVKKIGQNKENAA
ncbi:CBASS cGAMP-activated phospholipase [Acinetobacter sp. PK01]|uniref:CBASS cGAMP-activated phospholipase n=1 Tax=Acinetobacter sp. PK01 TaxID=2930198 RepID=UPI001FB7A7DE|nr:CBASS cGAMP-activated phospholipase [Acinetobacter sp. PK01]UOG19805.1 cGAMP-activated phospholipase CapV [Acinetobacter sp. PK01]